MVFTRSVRLLALATYLLVVAAAISVHSWTVVKDGGTAPLATLWPTVATAPASFLVMPATLFGAGALHGGGVPHGTAQVVAVGIGAALSVGLNVLLWQAIFSQEYVDGDSR